MSATTQALINLRALQHNFQRVKQFAPDSAVMAMVKSNGYGHGATAVAHALSHADGFGVATLAEAIKLREDGITAPIMIMSGFFDQEELKLIMEFDLQIVVHEFFQLDILESYKLSKPIKVWLIIDTGMHRLGFPPKEFLSVYQRLRNIKQIQHPIPVMTHLADADDINKRTTQQQIKLFDEILNDLQEPKSIANSAGILKWSHSHRDWVRPGLMLYGVSPFRDKMGKDFGLKPVMTLSSKIIAIHEVEKGEYIGYGGLWQTPEKMRVAVVAIGYGDGYPRNAKNGTPVLIHGTQCPIVGRVSMDMITVDLRHCPEAKIGDDVILWGKDLPIEIIAEHANSIGYELLCNVSQRVQFIYKQDDNQ